MKRTRYPERVIRLFLSAEVDVFKSALLHGEEVYVRGLLRITPKETEMSVQSPSRGRRRTRRIILRLKPTVSFRREMNQWTRGDPMDKFGVVVNPEATKLGTSQQACPTCGATEITTRGGMPYCPSCGFEPWEPHAEAETTTPSRPR